MSRAEASSVPTAGSSQNVMPRLIDADQAAVLLAVPASWVRAQARADRIPHVRLGRYVRFDPEQLLAWARARSRGPSRPAGEVRRLRVTGSGPVSDRGEVA